MFVLIIVILELCKMELKQSKGMRGLPTTGDNVATLEVDSVSDCTMACKNLKETCHGYTLKYSGTGMTCINHLT